MNNPFVSSPLSPSRPTFAGHTDHPSSSPSSTQPSQTPTSIFSTTSPILLSVLSVLTLAFTSAVVSISRSQGRDPVLISTLVVSVLSLSLLLYSTLSRVYCPRVYHHVAALVVVFVLGTCWLVVAGLLGWWMCEVWKTGSGFGGASASNSAPGNGTAMADYEYLQSLPEGLMPVKIAMARYRDHNRFQGVNVLSGKDKVVVMWLAGLSVGMAVVQSAVSFVSGAFAIREMRATDLSGGGLGSETRKRMSVQVEKAFVVGGTPSPRVVMGRKLGPKVVGRLEQCREAYSPGGPTRRASYISVRE